MTQFRLQRVLDHRKRREDELQQRLAAAMAALAHAENDLTLLIAEEARQRDELSRLLSGGRVDAGQIQMLGYTLAAYARSIAAQREEVCRRIAFEDEERGRLNSATSDRKALDKVKEQHERRELIDRNRRERELLEEIATARAARLRMAAALISHTPGGGGGSQ